MRRRRKKRKRRMRRGLTREPGGKSGYRVKTHMCTEIVLV